MVVAVPQKTSWNIKNATSQGSLAWLKKKPVVPIIPPWLTPNIRAMPRDQKMAVEMQKSTKFLIATLMLFFDRTKPLSRQENPACMSMTRAVQFKSHRMSIIPCVAGIMAPLTGRRMTAGPWAPGGHGSGRIKGRGPRACAAQ